MIERVFKVGDIVWYLDKYYHISIRKIIGIEYKQDWTGVIPVDTEEIIRYKISVGYEPNFDKKGVFSFADHLYPYPDGRKDLKDHLLQKIKWMKGDIEEMYEYLPSYFMKDDLAIEVTGKTHDEALKDGE